MEQLANIDQINPNYWMSDSSGDGINIKDPRVIPDDAYSDIKTMKLSNSVATEVHSALGILSGSFNNVRQEVSSSSEHNSILLQKQKCIKLNKIKVGKGSNTRVVNNINPTYIDSRNNISNQIKATSAKMIIDGQYFEENIEEQREILQEIIINSKKTKISNHFNQEEFPVLSSSNDHINKKINLTDHPNWFHNSLCLKSEITNNINTSSNVLQSKNEDNRDNMNQENRKTEEDKEEKVDKQQADETDSEYFPFNGNTGLLMIEKINSEILRQLVKKYGIVISSSASAIQDLKIAEAIAFYYSTNEETRSQIHETLRTIEGELDHQMKPYNHVQYTSLSGVGIQRVVPNIVIEDSNKIVSVVRHKLQNRIELKLSLIINNTALEAITKDINNSIPILIAVNNSMEQIPQYNLHHQIKTTAINSIRNDQNGNQIIAITRLIMKQNIDLDTIGTQFAQDCAIICLNRLHASIVGNNHIRTESILQEMISWVKSLKTVPGTTNQAILGMEDIPNILNGFDTNFPIAVYCCHINQPSVNLFAISNMAQREVNCALLESEIVGVITASSLYVHLPSSSTGMILLQIEQPLIIDLKEITLIKDHFKAKLSKLIASSNALNPGIQASNILKQAEAKRLTEAACKIETYTHIAVAGCTEDM